LILQKLLIFKRTAEHLDFGDLRYSKTRFSSINSCLPALANIFILVLCYQHMWMAYPVKSFLFYISARMCKMALLHHLYAHDETCNLA